ncbi:hypothetical protein D030_4220B, partial [Vibrio parahaemolyticus AQ3810]
STNGASSVVLSVT